MRRNIAAACVIAFAFAAGALAPKSFAEDETPPPTTTATITNAPSGFIGRYLLAEIERARREVWRWERLMRIRRTKAARVAEQTQDPDHRAAILGSWKRKAAARKRQAYNLPRMRAWICIHRFERHAQQGWRTNTGNGFFGGLQMDLSFQRTYGADLLRKKGTADRWLPIEQIWVAERAYRSGRGFYPWPNTARACGLI
jgi:Transglycosylase-like domain